MSITKHQPIKRNEELASLSREHHDGLLLSWKINAGVNKGIAVKRIRAYILYYFLTFMEPHFAEEEDMLYPLLAIECPERREAELQHAMLRVRIEYFKAGYELTTKLLKDFAEVLVEHIRYEERVLFNLIERTADPRALSRIVGKSRNILKIDNSWDDQFWLK